METVFQRSDSEALKDSKDSSDLDSHSPIKKRPRSSNDGGPTSAPASSGTLQHRINYPKKRVSVACELCRMRKTKCDAKRPSCSFCSQIGVECNYRRTIIPHSKLTADEDETLLGQDIVSRLDRIEQLLQTSNSALRPPNHLLQSPSDHRDTLPDPHDVYSPAISSHTEKDKGRAPTHNHPPPASTPLFGLNLEGLSRLYGELTPPALAPLVWDESEVFVERENRQGEAMFHNAQTDTSNLDLSHRACYRLQLAFSRNVLPWCPLFDQKDCIDIVTRTFDAHFPEKKLETALTLLMLALGAFSREEHHFDDEASQLPGLDYFQVACRIVSLDRGSRISILMVQCKIMMSFYYLLCLRPLQAFDTIHDASLSVLGLLQCRIQLEASPPLKQLVYRAYWACYLIEHEMQAYVSYSSCLLQTTSDTVPLPFSDHDEPGIYWFLTEISFRRLFSNLRDGLSWSTYTQHVPFVIDEIGSQMDRWYSQLPATVKFPLGTAPLVDPHRSFLRGQYYAFNSVIYWSFVVRLLTKRASDEAEYAKHLHAGRLSIEYATNSILVVEGLLQERHLFLAANVLGLYAMMIMLLCTYKAPALSSIQHPSMVDAIKKGRNCLCIWIANPGVAALVQRVESIMLQKGIGLSDRLVNVHVTPQPSPTGYNSSSERPSDYLDLIRKRSTSQTSSSISPTMLLPTDPGVHGSLSGR